MPVTLEVFLRFVALGCSSFGGPAAHIGYFRTTFVERLGWLDEASFARLVALSQFLPGPGSSQVGFAIGLERAGLAGGLAAFLGFTLPSFLLMATLVVLAPDASAGSWMAGLVAGLKLLAVVVVADAVRGMYGAFCGTRLAAAIAVGAACVLLAVPVPFAQIAVLLLAALVAVFAAGHMPVSGDASPPAHRPLRRWPLLVAGVAFAVLIPLGGQAPLLALARDFFQAGALVFGGGHVVLPLLQETVGTALGPEQFLAGYAVAQAVPGPMFTFAAWLGGALLPATPWLGALVATLAIFAPGLLLVLGLKDAWAQLAARPRLAAAASGINAAVVGLLLAALYRPVFTAAVHDGVDFALALAGVWLLATLRPPILLLVATYAGIGMARMVL